MKYPRVLVVAAIGLCAALWTYACGDGTTDPPPPDPPRATTVTVTPATAELTALGDTVRFSAQVLDQNGQTMAGATVTWLSSAPAVASVSSTGQVTAAGNGPATITANAGSASGTSMVTVAQEVSVVAVSPAADTLVAGDTLRLSAVAADANGHAIEGVEFAWASSDTLVAVVDDAGLVTGLVAGQAEVTATAAGITGRAELTVEAPAPTTVAVTPDTVALTALGETVQLSAGVRDQAGRVMEDIQVSWSSADTTVAAVDSAGLVTASGRGRTTITATAGEESGEAVVTVMQSVGSVVVSPPAATVALRDTLRLVAEAFDRNGHAVEGAEFSWSSSNVSVATVDASGLVTGLAEGTATITAMAGNASDTSEITVENPDRAALVALYNATDGPNWVDSENWLTDRPLGTWYGVVTDASERVVRLDLSGRRDNDVPHGLSGPIPSELGSLANLEILDLHANELTGPIPAELGTLADLEYLSLRSNALSGPIPPELGNLSKLGWLWLSSNDLSGPVPPELGNLSKLDWLWLGSNELSGPIPKELGNLANLSDLDLSVNRLSGPIPPELGNLSKLDRLWLGYNDLSGPIPKELGNLANLSHLDLSDNALTGEIPVVLGDLANLTWLNLDTNELSGRIPASLGKLANLTNLFLGGGPGGFGGNDFTGPIPPQLGDLSNLEFLDVGHNDFSGVIPPQLGKLMSLRSLSLHGNNLTGSIPPEFGGLASLRRLNLGSNDLAGPVPPQMGRLSNLQVLDLSNNMALAGALPVELTDLSGIETMVAGGTGLCAPKDPAFEAWLAGIPEQRIARCVDMAAADAYLTQAVQSREFPVPLVAGDKALLRVFATAARVTSEGIPDVRARFYLDGRETHAVTIRGKSASIPTQVTEGELAASANAEIRGHVIQPGLEVVIEVDPEGTLDPGLGVARRIPETGRMAVDVEAMPLFDLTLIPFVWSENQDSSIVDLVRAMAADPENHDMLEATRTLLPVGDLAVTAHPPVVSSSNSGYDLLDQTEAIRVIEGGSGHYMGMTTFSTEAGGVARRRGRSSFSIPYPDVLAHELGHNFSLDHAPCGRPRGVDPRFPYPDGSIGAWGYDFRDDGLVAPSTPDVMSYCEPEWISDYHFTKALRFRLADEGGGATAPAATRSLLVWGGLDADSVPFLRPAFVLDAPPVLPDSDGDHQLVGWAVDDGELFSVSFAMPEMADGAGAGSFVFALPVRPGWEALARLSLSGPDGSVTLDETSDQPMAILRDPRTGQVRGILSDVPPSALAAADAAGRTVAPGLGMLFSRGIPSTEAWRR